MIKNRDSDRRRWGNDDTLKQVLKIPISVTRWGKPLAKSYYRIDFEKRVFTSKYGSLVFDFPLCHDWTFNIMNPVKRPTDTWDNQGNRCIFNTGFGCTFNVGWGCTFNTGDNCTFNTMGNSKFDVGANCTFNRIKSPRTKNEPTIPKDSSMFSLWNINSCKFKSYDEGYDDVGSYDGGCDGLSIILDRADNKHYVLTEEFIQLQKVKNG